jgi:hypothetical protein
VRAIAGRLVLLAFAAICCSTAAAYGLAPVADTPDPQSVDLAKLVPGDGKLDHVWYVPRGRTVPEIVVAWSFRGRPIVGWPERRRYAVTLWHPERITPVSAVWIPHTLIRESPFPLTGRSIRLADVTGDGHDDLLVTVYCTDCNHGAAVAAIYATFGRSVRRIYGHGSMGVAKGPGHDAVVHGRPVTETWWGARRGLVWFDTGWYERTDSVCCPRFRLQTFYQWTGHGWRTVARHRVRPQDDRLSRGPMP